MLNKRGVSRAVVLLAIIAACLIIAIIIPVATGVVERRAREADDLHEQTAINSARLRFVQEEIPFNAIYDCENKQFVDLGTGVGVVEPYGNSKEHEGLVIYLRVNEKGEVFIKWVDPKDYGTDL